MSKLLSSIIILILLIGCGSLQEKFEERIKKADARSYRYCVMAISVEANGKLNQSEGVFGCHDTENIKNETITKCESNSGKKCLVSRIYDRFENKIMNNEARGIEEIKIRQRQEYTDNLGSQCTSYGFQKGTQAFADCMLKINQQNALNQQQEQALRIQQEALNLQQLQHMLAPPRPISPQIRCTTIPGSITTTCQ